MYSRCIVIWCDEYVKSKKSYDFSTPRDFTQQIVNRTDETVIRTARKNVLHTAITRDSIVKREDATFVGTRNTINSLSVRKLWYTTILRTRSSEANGQRFASEIASRHASERPSRNNDRDSRETKLASGIPAGNSRESVGIRLGRTVRATSGHAARTRCLSRARNFDRSAVRSVPRFDFIREIHRQARETDFAESAATFVPVDVFTTFGAASRAVALRYINIIDVRPTRRFTMRKIILKNTGNNDIWKFRRVMTKTKTRTIFLHLFTFVKEKKNK